MSLKDLIADVNVNEICEHIETETLSEWVNAWQEAAISALRPISRECGNKGLFSLHFCPGCGAPLTENGEEILVGRLNEALKDGKGD